MEIDIKSLRIGSHVAICGGERVRVTAVRSNGIVTTTLGDMDVQNLTPIALTPDLLTEMGFARKDIGDTELWWIGNFKLSHDKEVDYWKDYTWDYASDIRLKYLHDFEDLFYLIYAEELIKD